MHTQRLDDRTVIVTGATSGIGYFIAEGLAGLGAHIVVAARSAQKAKVVLELLPGPGRHRYLPFDLSDIASVRRAGGQVAAGGPIDGLVMNAGVVAAPPHFATGPLDVESTSGRNVLAHMEFLRLAMPALQRAPAARVVSIGSMLTRKIPFDQRAWLSRDLYHPRRAYALSKHATEILGFELDRRLRAGQCCLGGDASGRRHRCPHPRSAAAAPALGGAASGRRSSRPAELTSGPGKG